MKIPECLTGIDTLALSIASGDRTAENPFFEQLGPTLERWIGRRVSGQDRDDVMARTHERVLGSLRRGKYRGGSDETCYSYVRKIAFRVLSQYWDELARQKGVMCVDEDLANGKPTPGEWAADQEVLELLNAAVAKLPLKDRQALSLRFQEQLTYREMGERWGMQTGSAEARVRSALEKLRKMLPEI